MFIAHKNVTERDAVPNTDRMQCASMTKHVVFEHMCAVWAVMCAGSSSLAAEVNSHDFKKDAVGSDGFGSWHEQKSKHMIRVTGLHMEEDFHLCDTSLQKQVEGQMSSSTDVISTAVTKLLKKGLSCSEGKEEDFNKESLLQLSSLNKTYIAVTVPHWADLPELDCGLKKIARRGIGYKIQTVLLDEQ
ncbi:hypothetical protein DPMN_075162 [Dreissena polymorpha]|uniref:Uncharacterized protein n=1 Tax=Dreissena polymorpha TaxID=45954 RepID=A0A9D3YHL5_DREPO|nr:hypothetical protein DPMN_075162 [Dreissena polymorpha]